MPTPGPRGRPARVAPSRRTSATSQPGASAPALGFMPASADTIAAYLASLADGGLAASIVMCRLAAIGYAPARLGHDSPTRVERVRQVEDRSGGRRRSRRRAARGQAEAGRGTRRLARRRRHHGRTDPPTDQQGRRRFAGPPHRPERRAGSQAPRGRRQADPSLFSGHSLRASFVTSAPEDGATRCASWTGPGIDRWTR